MPAGTKDTNNNKTVSLPVSFTQALSTAYSRMKTTSGRWADVGVAISTSNTQITIYLWNHNSSYVAERVSYIVIGY